MNKFIISVCFGFLTLFNAFAGRDNPRRINDSIRLNEVVVTGTMPKVNLRNVPVSLSIVSGRQIENCLEPSLLPLLTEEVPGLFITRRGIMGYGVAAGSAGGMSIRGVGGTPTSGVLILIDGHPQYMGLMGHPLADSYQSMMADRVEVIRGPASVLYGSNAMGGVINIITKKQRGNGRHSSTRLMYGSYNTLSAEATAGWRKNKLHMNASIGYNRSDGHRENMNFEQINGYGKVEYDFTLNWSGFVDLNLSRTRSSNPGSISLPIIDNDADIARGMVSFAFENEYEKTAGAMRFFCNFGTHEINDGYTRGSQPKDYRFKSNDRMLGLSIHQSYSFVKANKTMAGFDFLRFGGKAYTKFPDETQNLLLVDKHINNAAGYLNTQQTLLGNKFVVNAGIRLDYHTKNGSEWIPQFSVTFAPTTATAIKAMVSKGFRNPTIREMYMFPPKNPNLKPERLMNYEVSLLQTLLENKLSLELNLFYIKGENTIQVAMVEGRPLNVNTGEIDNKGIEIDIKYQATSHLQVSANYSFLDMKHKIVAAPGHKLHVGGNYTKNRWSLSSGIQYVGNLYKSVRPEFVKENFVLWNTHVNYRVSACLNLFLKGENLLGQKYEINAGYPMPATIVSGGMRLHI